MAPRQEGPVSQWPALPGPGNYQLSTGNYRPTFSKHNPHIFYLQLPNSVSYMLLCSYQTHPRPPQCVFELPVASRDSALVPSAFLLPDRRHTRVTRQRRDSGEDWGRFRGRFGGDSGAIFPPRPQPKSSRTSFQKSICADSNPIYSLFYLFFCPGILPVSPIRIVANSATPCRE